MSAALQIALPDIGDYRDVPVIELLVKPGDRLAVDDLILSIESDKATMEVPSPVAGTVRELLVAVGSKVSEGTPILVVEPAEGGEAADAPPPPPSAGEGTLRSRGGEGQRDDAGFTPVVPLPDTALPSPDPLRGPPSPLRGGGWPTKGVGGGGGRIRKGHDRCETRIVALPLSPPAAHCTLPRRGRRRRRVSRLTALRRLDHENRRPLRDLRAHSDQQFPHGAGHRGGDLHGR
ncbi:hypothetical protein MKK65_01445, partial [Methylobacterium sp. J-001]